MKYNLAEDAATMQISHDIVALVMRAQSPQHQSLGKMRSAKFRVCISAERFTCCITRENKNNIGCLKTYRKREKKMKRLSVFLNTNRETLQRKERIS